jgi:phosphoribosylformimino-5-aminoimidazole carboxamide ribotide isomerase
MEVIPVLDLRQGKAVHAIGGDRSRYAAVHSALAPGAEGDPFALARAFRLGLRSRSCYVADLNALMGASPQLDLLARLADPALGFGPGLLVDAAVRTPADAVQLVTRGVTKVVVGLESLRRPDELAPIVAAIGAGRVVFSLDLRDGLPVAAADWTEGRDPAAIARAAVAAGIESILVLDLARVGAGDGPALEAIGSVRAAAPDAMLLAGGGIRDVADLEALEALGVLGALVGSALHRGGFGDYIESRNVAD